MKLPVINIFYGRFNPITNGHVNSIKSILTHMNVLSTHKNLILLSSKRDINNPLSIKQKRDYFSYFFPNVESKSLKGDLEKYLIRLQKKYNKINIFVGEDRLHKFISLGHSLEKKHKMNISVYCTGKRIENVSGSHFRNFIMMDNKEGIRTNIIGLFPSKSEENKYIKTIKKNIEKYKL